MRAEEVDLHDISLADKLDASTAFDLDFVELQVIADVQDLENFLCEQRSDYYSESILKEEGIISRAENWLQGAEEKIGVAFMLAVDKPDNFSRNDDWGHTDLFEAVIFPYRDALHIHLVEKVQRFFH